MDARLGLVDEPFGQVALELAEPRDDLAGELLHLPPQCIGPLIGVGRASLEGVPGDLQLGPRGLGALGRRDAHLALVGLGGAVGPSEVRQSGGELRPLVPDAVEGRLRLFHAALDDLLALGREAAHPDDVAEAVDEGAEAFDGLLDGRLGDAEAELARGLRFEVVGLVDDQVAVFREQGAADFHVGEQQGVVHDYEVRGGGLVAGVAVETRAFASAGAGGEAAGVDPVP